MVISNDVPVNELVTQVASELKKMPEMNPPEWAAFVKTGAHKERPPVDEDWWFTRSAAMLLKIQKLGPVGVSKLRVHYGGKKNRGVRPGKFVKGSGNIARKIMQQLDSIELTKKVEKEQRKGRIIQPKGVSLLDKCAKTVQKAQKKGDN